MNQALYAHMNNKRKMKKKEKKEKNPKKPKKQTTTWEAETGGLRFRASTGKS
jgi:hypothetical protein